MEEEYKAYTNLVWRMKGNNHLGDQSIYVRVILKWMLKEVSLRWIDWLGKEWQGGLLCKRPWAYIFSKRPV